jgi:hypothetical protein
MKVSAITELPFFQLRRYNEFQAADLGERREAVNSLPRNVWTQHPVIPPLRAAPNGITRIEMGSEPTSLANVSAAFKAFLRTLCKFIAK